MRTDIRVPTDILDLKAGLYRQNGALVLGRGAIISDARDRAISAT